MRQPGPAAKPVEPGKDSIDFDGFIFPGSAWFENCTFAGDASFNRAAFLGSARFDSAAFMGNAWFNTATFAGYTRFNSATFAGNTWLDSAVFSGSAVFNSTVFSGNALFGSANFYGSVGFNGANFSGYVSFGGASFSGGAYFRDASFGGGAWFNATAFSREARFEGAAFTGNAWFDGATFRKIATFEQTKFGKEATFEGIEAKRAFNMTGAAFAKTPAFAQADFGRAPDFGGVRLPLPRFWLGGDAGLIAKYSAIRRLAIQGADYEREHMAFKGELRSRRWAVDRWWHPGLWLGLFYDGVADCGRSIVRPLAAWLALLAIFPAFYLLSSGIPVAAWQSACANSPSHQWERAVSLSLSNSVPIIVNTRSEDTRAFLACRSQAATPGAQPKLDSPLSLTALQLLQTLLSATLIFLFLLAVKNRFKIK